LCFNAFYCQNERYAGAIRHALQSSRLQGQ
jgi:hypothetical protein